ncbi:TetR/AcrR family transcriptional regulator C-terminal domain-containing protein [Nannocystis radixulma]|uniref:TetR/AcrR family transcriptional regulator C-terminal domain-containing protein n=1 Tax=Nannocystis radixulma TaxID=2995305 RepID=A0ABT5BDS5_9BACT|nr:TetR/AcrR family transcriptional regulator C-terminal domain-containing protein [Nannocystis radixulma]MDC0671212.1 TetR/AcrR family transcriptional regulator C-terminal domain-containing protein [Nannocystis radixulma]
MSQANRRVAAKVEKGRPSRRGEPLSRQRVVAAAIALVDAEGRGALTMRSLADALGVQPMSLYNHVRGKEDLLDGMVDQVFGEIVLPNANGSWRPEMRARAVSARQVLSRHPWALGLLQSRAAPGPATLRHHDAVVGVLMNAGFSLAMTARAYAIVDAYVYGFVLQEATLPLDERGTELAQAIGAGPKSADFPYLAAFAAGHVMQPGYDFGAEFEPGLDIVLDAVGSLAG